MHYANGREVKVGDKVVGRDPSGEPVGGIVVVVDLKTPYCNLGIVPFTSPKYAATASACLHVDDVVDASKWKEAYENMKAFAERSGLDVTCRMG